MPENDDQMNKYLQYDYANKSAEYYVGGRADYIAALPSNPSAKVLELGCGDGTTGAIALKSNKCLEYVGIEMFPPAASLADERISRVHIGNIESMELPYDNEYFDALIMSEVLEHLVDPYSTLKKLVSLVKIGGDIMASSPNVAHWRIIRELILGRFNYTDAGAMDRTHLRWFTPSSYASMFRDAGVQIDKISSLEPLSGKRRFIMPILGKRFGHLISYQTNLIGRRIR